jgi:hypothetical protein
MLQQQSSLCESLHLCGERKPCALVCCHWPTFRERGGRGSGACRGCSGLAARSIQPSVLLIFCCRLQQMASNASSVDWGSCAVKDCPCREGRFADDHTSDSICLRCPHPRFNHNTPGAASTVATGQYTSEDCRFRSMGFGVVLTGLLPFMHFQLAVPPLSPSLFRHCCPAALLPGGTPVLGGSIRSAKQGAADPAGEWKIGCLRALWSP